MRSTTQASLGRFRFGAISFVDRATGHDEITWMDILPEGVHSGSAGRILLALEMTLEISGIRNKT
jgi:hypothetical protein